MSKQSITNGPKVWLITGSSRGFGRVWTAAALQRGDQVAATARNVESLADFKEQYGDQVLTLPLDVTQPSQVQAAVQTAHAGCRDQQRRLFAGGHDRRSQRS